MTAPAGGQETETRVPRFEVTVEVAGHRYYVEVPTFQGSQAAGRRAWLSLWSKHRNLDPGQVRVVEVKPL